MRTDATNEGDSTVIELGEDQVRLLLESPAEFVQEYGNEIFLYLDERDNLRWFVKALEKDG